MRPRNVVLGWLLLALLVGFFFSGSLLYKSLIGLDASAFPLGVELQGLVGTGGPAVGGLLMAVLAILATALVGFGVTMSAVRAQQARTDPARRRFLTGAAGGTGVALGSVLVGGVAAGVRTLFGVGEPGRGWMQINSGIQAEVVKTHPEWLEAWKGARVKSFRRLGRTGWRVSDIVVGSGPVKGDKGTDIVRAALDRGVNYVDTAPDYSATGSEQAVGKALRGRRSEVFLATKFCTPIGHLPPGTPVAEYKSTVESSLQRLGTDYVDLIHIHSCDEVERLMDPNVHEAFDRLKEEGKVRFLGVSTHTPNLVDVANAAIDSGRFDVMMLAYHHGIWAPLDGIIERARAEQDMGIVAMKTLKGAKHHGLSGFRDDADAYSQAALRWVLSNANVSCAVISFFEHQHVDEYLYASGGTASAGDLAVLEKYDRQIVGTYCAPHCGQCLDRCPEGAPIHDVLRHRMYFEDYGWEKDAMQLYARLERNASKCASCSAPCLSACPVGIPIQERMAGAHELLRLS